MVTRTRKANISLVDDKDTVKTPPSKHAFRTVRTVLALVRDKLTGGKDSVRSRFNIRGAPVWGEDVYDINESAGVVIQDSDRPPHGIEQTLRRAATMPHVGYEWDQWKGERHNPGIQEIISALNPPINENPSVGDVQGLALINPHNTTSTSAGDYSGIPARSTATTTTFSLGRSDLQTLDSYQVSMGGSIFAHPMGPNVSLLQPPSRPLAHPARSHVSFHTPSSLHMHPLLAYSLHAPIQYDVGQIPSAQTVLDCFTHSPVPHHTLAQPATDPPIGGPDQLLLKSDKLPWTVVVKSWAPALRGGLLNSRTIPGDVITNSVVLYTIHTTLQACVTPEEWGALGNGSRAQRKATQAYEKRCSDRGGWDVVRRVDWLGSKHHLIGIEMGGSSGGRHPYGKLVFARIY